MIGSRDRPWRRLGAFLTGLGLGLQLVLSSLGLLLAAAAAEPAATLSGHALCFAGEPVAPQPSPAGGDSAPAAPAHQHVAFCCLWHQLPGVQPAAALAAQPLDRFRLVSAEPELAAFTPSPAQGPANARAPPT
jgi:hypothetical protein